MTDARFDFIMFELYEAAFHAAQGEFDEVLGILAALEPEERAEFTDDGLEEIREEAAQWKTERRSSRS